MKNYKILILSGAAIINLLFFVFSAKGDASELKVYFFDVGQGDAIFIEAPNGKQILIDGGPDNSVIQKLSKAMPFWDRTIDLILLTHHDADHLTGLVEVLKRYEVKGIIETGIQCEKPDCLVWRKLKEKEKAVNVAAKLGQEIIIDENMKMVILHPLENLIGKKVSKANNTSVVAKLVFGGYSFLLTGDIEEQTERKLVLAGIDIDSDYLKVAHHGSKTSTSDQFLDGASPLMAFISLDLDNRYGHPHREVVERLEKRNIKYYRTDASGTILLRCRLNEPCQVVESRQLPGSR